jgi:hypothetical protein
VADRAELDRLLADNEFNRAGLFVGSAPRVFADFLEPLEVPPLDAGLAVTIVEGRATEPAHARAGLVGLRKSGRVAFGGLFPDGAGLAVVRDAVPSDAARVVGDAGGWSTPTLVGRAWSQTL